MIKLGIIIPDRGDRPEFLKNCLRMISGQTLKPEIIELVNDYPLSNDIDITYRYRIGYERLRNKGLDVIAFIENDDWYSPVYLQYMTSQWQRNGKPDLFGTNYTYYYHLKLRAWHKMEHFHRASAMNTLIKPDLNFTWCADNEPFTDIHLWKTLKGACISPESIISMGMKHGTGLCGGTYHVDRLNRYKNQDPDLSMLKSNIDYHSYGFYSKLML
jgi:hypothetical protein